MLNHILFYYEFIYVIYFWLIELERKREKEKKKKKKKKKLHWQRLLSLYPKLEHSELEIQVVEFNKNGEVQFKHSSTFVPKHSEHP